MGKGDDFLHKYAIDDDKLEQGEQLRTRVSELEAAGQNLADDRQANDDKLTELQSSSDFEAHKEEINGLVQEQKSIDLQIQSNDFELGAAKNDYEVWKAENASPGLEQETEADQDSYTSWYDNAGQEGDKGELDQATKEQAQEAVDGLSSALDQDDAQDLPGGENKNPSLDTNKNFIQYDNDGPQTGQMNPEVAAQVDEVKQDLSSHLGEPEAQDNNQEGPGDGGNGPDTPGSDNLDNQEQKHDLNVSAGATPEQAAIMEEVNANSGDKSADEVAQEMQSKLDEHAQQKQGEQSDIDPSEGKLSEYGLDEDKGPDGPEKEVVGELSEKDDNER